MHFLLSASVFNVHFIREIIGMVMASMSIRTTMFMREGEQNKIIYNCHPWPNVGVLWCWASAACPWNLLIKNSAYHIKVKIFEYLLQKYYPISDHGMQILSNKLTLREICEIQQTHSHNLSHFYRSPTSRNLKYFSVCHSPKRNGFLNIF